MLDYGRGSGGCEEEMARMPVVDGVEGGGGGLVGRLADVTIVHFFLCVCGRCGLSEYILTDTSKYW